MPGSCRHSHPWPLFALRITTPRLELRVPDDDDLAALFAAARAGIHPPGEMPFGVPWTDDVDKPGGLERFLAFHWTARGTLSPEHWSLPFAVVAEGSVVGVQELAAHEFAGTRSVSSGSWLTASAQGRGIGLEMRAAVLHLAFAGLGALEAVTSAWYDNPASQRVSLRLGYRQEGEQLIARGGEPTRHLRYRLTREAWQREHFDGIEIHALEPCLAMLGAA
jgi:RimJ/RimL family protein N-acetyltransferase